METTKIEFTLQEVIFLKNLAAKAVDDDTTSHRAEAFFKLCNAREEFNKQA